MSLEDDGPRPPSAPNSAEQPSSARIAELNDRLRVHRVGGRVVMTSGIDALGSVALAAILVKLTAFSDFNRDNDPHGERDLGLFDHGGERILWKIDAYDQAMQGGSPDPADPAVTTRVLTIMLAAEY